MYLTPKTEKIDVFFRNNTKTFYEINFFKELILTNFLNLFNKGHSTKAPAIPSLRISDLKELRHVVIGLPFRTYRNCRSNYKT